MRGRVGEWKRLQAVRLSRPDVLFALPRKIYWKIMRGSHRCDVGFGLEKPSLVTSHK
jgi:hypothetical protein